MISMNLVIELPKNIDIYKYTIKIIENKQPFYQPIYALSLVELENLKIYIKTFLKTGFIQSCKTLANTFILLNEKPDNNFCLCQLLKPE